MFHSLKGAAIEDIDTPALLIDLDVMERNIEMMAHYFGMPIVKGYEDIIITSRSEEHARMEIKGKTGQELELGDKIELIPSHCCTTTNLHDQFYAMRNGQVEAIWKIPARGKFQ